MRSPDSGMWAIVGPKSATSAARSANAAPTPSRAERQPFVVPTATTMVRASTISTALAKNTVANRATSPDEESVVCITR